MNLHVECFLVIWCVLIVLFFCFSVFVEVKFLCWNRCHSSRSSERNRVCIQPNPAISNHIYPRSNHIYPRHVFSGWGSLSPPPFIHFDLSFSPDWNNFVCNVLLLLNSKKGHTNGFKWVIVWIQPDPTISKHAWNLIISNPEMYLKEGWASPPFLSYILDLFFFWSKD